MSKFPRIGRPLNLSRRGFTLVELIVASALSALVVMAILSLQTGVIGAQQRQIINSKLAGGAARAAEALKRDIRAASVIIEPAGAATANTLVGYANVNPLDLTTPLLSSEPAVYFKYCTDSTGTSFYRYSGTVPIPISFVPFVCGQAPASGQTREILISNAASLTYLFGIGAANKNVLEVSYLALSAKEKVSGSFRAQFQRGL
ncbi:MAG: prepilin-type N-terminal cleavage/methylation domain-containing protein [Elusimicrobiales bacterium]|nr:prepilin-type N-terminal cleavage/methylation domain-containing protein [Elusimicrobiales bacterium]